MLVTIHSVFFILTLFLVNLSSAFSQIPTFDEPITSGTYSGSVKTVWNSENRSWEESGKCSLLVYGSSSEMMQRMPLSMKGAFMIMGFKCPGESSTEFNIPTVMRLKGSYVDFMQNSLASYRLFDSVVEPGRIIYQAAYKAEVVLPLSGVDVTMKTTRVYVTEILFDSNSLKISTKYEYYDANGVQQATARFNGEFNLVNSLP